MRTHNGGGSNAAAVLETDRVSAGAVGGGEQLRRDVVGGADCHAAAAAFGQPRARTEVAELHVAASVGAH